MRYHSNYHRQQGSAGFGMVELMVSISIMVLVTTVMIARQSAFNGAVLLRNQAYEVAFTIRQAQLLAVSGGQQDARQYGVHFDVSAANNTSYWIFRDSNMNGRYDGTSEQIGLTGRLDDRFVIRAIETQLASASTLSVSFERPNFDAKLCTRAAGCTAAQYTQAPAWIDVAKKGSNVNDKSLGVVRRVAVTATGQISVIPYAQ